MKLSKFLTLASKGKPVTCTVQAPTRLHLPRLIKFVKSQGIAEITKTDPATITFDTDGNTASWLLTEMKHRFPISYWSGWSDKRNS
jgi:hypothetical protein